MAYQQDRDRIRRQRLMAEMLQQGGSQPHQQQVAGGMVVPVSGWENVGKIAQAALGAYGAHQADRAEAELDQRQRTDMQKWAASMPKDRNQQMAWALRGQDFGAMGEAAGAEALARALAPEESQLMKVGDNLYNPTSSEWITPPASPTEKKPNIHRAGDALYNADTQQWLTPPAQPKPADEPEAPSNVREYEYWSSLTPEQQQEYLNVKRAMQFQNLGGVPSVVTPGADGPTTKPLATVDQIADNQATIAGARAAAESEAKSNSVPPAVKAKIDDKLKTVDLIDAQLDKIQTAFNGIKDTFSAGPFGQGRVPSEAGNAFDQAVAPVRVLIRQLTRTPGEGAMSDFESRLALAINPDRTNYEKVTQQQIDQMRDMVNMIRAGYSEMLPAAAATPADDVAEPTGMPTQIASDADYDALPSGTVFIGPDGVKRRKP